MRDAAKELVVNGLRTRYFEAGEGPTLILLHSGEYGAAADLCWEENFSTLATQHKVIAPEWIGYGESAKIHDFELGPQRLMMHLRDFVAALGVGWADYVGVSMGGSLLVRTVAADPEFLDVRSMTLVGGGGAAPDNAYRRALIDYDCTMDGMRAVVEALFHDQRWSLDEEYVRRRYEISMLPGAWECAAATRFKNPTVPAKTSYAQPDLTDYRKIACPVLIIGGANDKLKEPGYANRMAAEISDCEVHMIPDCGHLANIEKSSVVNDLILRFLDRTRSQYRQ